MSEGNGETQSLLGSTNNPAMHHDKNEATIYSHQYQYSSDEPSLFQFSKWSLPNRDQDAIRFGVRMSVCLTASSLFVLLQLPKDYDADSPDDASRFHEGMWVLITMLFVCWFPAGDAASVLEKSLQRLVGTFLGAGLGLACGVLSLEVERMYGIRAQALCLGCCIALVSFVVCTYAVHARVGRGARLIERKNYATILCLLTFTICLVPFYSMEGGHWHKSLYRVTNVVIGCFLGVGLSMLVLPRPTVAILHDKVSRQIQLAGESSEAVLHTAAVIFAEESYVPTSLADEILEPLSKSLRCSGRKKRSPSVVKRWRKAALDSGHDVVLEKYEEAMKECKAAKAQLGMLKYDPFNIGQPNKLLEAFQNEVAQTLARATRIQTTVVLIDSIVHNDPKHRFLEEELELLANAGTLVRKMLSVPFDVAASDDAAQELCSNLVEMRRMIVDLAASISSSPERQMPSIVHEQDGLFGSSLARSSIDLAGMYNRNSPVSLFVGGEQLDDDQGGKGAPTHVRGSRCSSFSWPSTSRYGQCGCTGLLESSSENSDI